MATQSRTPEEIRASIEQNRLELGSSLERLRVEVQKQIMIGAGVAGFVLDGGLAALGGLTFGRRRRSR